MILVTGGAGFIGANFVLGWLAEHDEAVVNVDKLTYAGNLSTLDSLRADPRHQFVRADIADIALLQNLLVKYRPRAVLQTVRWYLDRSDWVHQVISGDYLKWLETHYAQCA
ncbi:dTDP-glucose 4,6-dehydratase RfbB [Mycoavidus cysteinexigens]|uniref:dTDP-glucose 4,6-dehydratase RfbB n=1 Tax=Mycoavidus cysteinexigens TaxID=1553431 RepID=A0A2Z6ETE8_9BURK|nr:dTDP-glucose 4,6-dehydratase RfbB [Mycoavidus cysteinexigens]GAM52594.1 dTDP-glucose 4,6-dehydratase [bacterium endosymbiont of Mortierella elongata FMR23-6]GLR01444.1 hypothetical protein GCM10007934_12560 [Mycoavidus cysteinexigens]